MGLANLKVHDGIPYLKKQTNKSCQIWKLFISLHKKSNVQYFQTRFLEEAEKFISELDIKTIKKIFYNLDIAEQTNDPKLFKKLQNDIWELE